MLAIRKKHKGENDPAVGKALSNVGSIYMRTGRYSEAEPLLLRAKEINAADPKGETDITAGCLMSLGNLYVKMGRFAEAEPLFRRAVEIVEPFGPKLPYYKVAQHNLATFYLAAGRYAEAEPIFKRLLKPYEEQYGRDSTAVGMVLGDLGVISQASGRYEEAEESLQRTVKIFERKLGPENPDVAERLASLASVDAAQGRWADAVLRFLSVTPCPGKVPGAHAPCPCRR